MMTPKPTTITQYISAFPKDIQKMLEQIRATIKKALPDGEETISYGIPSFTLNGHYIVYFAAYKKHIGVYPVPDGDAELNKAFAPYKTSGKGTIQFPLDKPMPLDLITKIVQFNIKRNAEKKAKKKTTKIKQ
jgi:uncharacterized protein YdhG (YjbR/CyaY superfamily)